MKYLFETILHYAIEENVSDIHITTNFQEIAVRFRKKGELSLYKTLNLEEGNRLFQYILFLSHLSLDYKMNLKTGTFNYQLESHTYRLRVSSIPTLSGNHLVIRLLDHEIFNEIEQLTIDHNMISNLKKICNLDHGLVLISGPTGVGKTTTLNVILQDIYNQYHSNIITIEDPIELLHPYFTQIQISHKISYDQALRQILRHDPDVIMIGELRDEYSAALAIRCALTGTLVIATIHSHDSKTTLKRIQNLNVNKDDLEEVLQYIICQKLYYSKEYTTAYFEFLDYQNNELYPFDTSLQEVKK